jgi:hypothetical protein
MKLQRFVLALVAFAFVWSPQSPDTAVAQSREAYRAKLISPKPGEVLTPGKVVRIEWIADYPNVDLAMCETEVLLSLDGGKTVYMMLRELRNPKEQYFDWTVPNVSTKEAALDIRFGCMNVYPESSSIQQTFQIGTSAK